MKVLHLFGIILLALITISILGSVKRFFRTNSTLGSPSQRSWSYVPVLVIKDNVPLEIQGFMNAIPITISRNEQNLITIISRFPTHNKTQPCCPDSGENKNGNKTVQR